MKPRNLGLALAALAASACATAADDSMVIRSTRAEVERFAGEPVDSVAQRPIRGGERWESIGDYGLIVWESRTRAWLLDLGRGEPQCEDLSDEYLMHVDPRVDWLSSRSGTIELHNGRWCEIEKIRPLDAAGLRKARKSQGIRNPY